MVRRPPRSTRTDTLFPTRRSSDPQSAPHRADPPCPFFGPCGGCALQHLEASAYAAWKEEQLAVALQRRGLVADTLHPLRRVAPGRRRRITWSAKRTARGAPLGDRKSVV